MPLSPRHEEEDVALLRAAEDTQELPAEGEEVLPDGHRCPLAGTTSHHRELLVQGGCDTGAMATGKKPFQNERGEDQEIVRLWNPEIV